MVAELAVWSGVIGALSVLMARVRGHRIAQAELARCDQLTRLANRRECAEDDSNLHPVIPGQALNLIGRMLHASARRGRAPS